MRREKKQRRRKNDVRNIYSIQQKLLKAEALLEDTENEAMENSICPEKFVAQVICLRDEIERARENFAGMVFGGR
jgi:hypothetical protein